MCAWPGLVESNWKNTSYSVYKKGSATLVSVLRLAAMKKLRSTTNSSSDVPFSAEQIHAFRLRRHHLLDQSGKDLVTICRDVCGVQAQIMSAAQLQLWARNHAITPAIVNDALLISRTLVKTSLMRQTLHLVPADEFPLYIAAQKKRRVGTVLTRMAKFKITREEAEEMSGLILDFLKAGPAPRVAIAAAVRPKVSKRIHKWMEESWSMVRLPIAEGQICYGPGEGNQAMFIRTDQWLPPMRPVDEETAQKELFRKYLRAYGPATLNDFSHWCGISMPAVKALRLLLDSEIAEYNGLLLLREDIKALQADAAGLNSVHLLPYFDVYLLAHRLKEHFLNAKFYKRVYRDQGWISPVVLINGEIAGVWSHKLSRKAVEIEIELFARVGPRTRKQIKGRARQLADLFQCPLLFSFKN